MKTEILGVLLTFGITLALAIPLGKIIAKIYKGERNLFDFMKPLESFIFKLSGINPHIEMDWKQHLKALLTINLLWFVYAFFIFRSFI